MPYVFLVRGECLRVTPDDAVDLRGQIENDDEFEAMRRAAKGAGLVLDTQNDDRNELTVFMGQELYPDRHIYRGLTVTVGLGSESGEHDSMVRSTMDKILTLLAKYTDADVKREAGLVMSQFD